MRYELTTKVNRHRIDQQLNFVDDSGVREKVAMWVIDTREKDIRKALLKLGWTLPKNET